MGEYKADAEIIAQKLTQARFACGKSMKDCAAAIATSNAHYKKIECGEILPTLPELETLSYFLNIPLSSLLGNQRIVAVTVSLGNSARFIEIRNSAIGTLLQIEREKKAITLKEMAERSEIQRSRLKRYESGTIGIPIHDLLKMAEVLSIDPAIFFDKNSPIGLWQSSQQTLQAFLAQPSDLQEFIIDPANLPYLELAQKLKGLQPQDLGAMAGAIQLILQNLPINQSGQTDQAKE